MTNRTPEPREGLTVEWTPAMGPRRRVRFEPLSGGDGWSRVTERFTGCRWIPEGREPIRDLVVEGGEVTLP